MKIKHEFKSLEPFLFKGGFLRGISCFYKPEQNGVIEKKNLHVVETGLAMAIRFVVPLQYWEHGLKIAVYLINRLPSKTLDYKSSY